MRIKFDKEADAVFVIVRNTDIVKTIEVDIDTYIDLDAENRIVRIELLNAHELLERNQFDLHIPEEVIDPATLTRELVFG